MLKTLSARLPIALLALLAATAHADILTSIKPLTLIAAAVTAGVEQPQQLLPDGVSAHDYSLRPSDRQRLQQAELIVWIGPAHEGFLNSVLKGQSRALTVAALPGLTRLPLRRVEDSSPLPGTLDAHLWLHPENAIRIADAIAAQRARQNPAQAARYRANAARFAANLRQTWIPLQQRIAALPHRRYAAYHDAYQYLEHSLGLQFSGSLSASPESRPGARHLLLLKTRLRDQQVRCLVREPGSSAALLQQVAPPGGRQAVLDETFAQAGSFIEGMQTLGQRVEACLGK